jgi:uncharacterized protein (DUF302 family)
VSVDDTVSRIAQLLEAKGVKLFAVIDHRGEARAAGLELPDTRVVIFGKNRHANAKRGSRHRRLLIEGWEPHDV